MFSAYDINEDLDIVKIKSNAKYYFIVNKDEFEKDVGISTSAIEELNNTKKYEFSINENVLSITKKVKRIDRNIDYSIGMHYILYSVNVIKYELKNYYDLVPSLKDQIVISTVKEETKRFYVQEP